MMIYDLEMALRTIFPCSYPFYVTAERQTNATVQTICFVAEPFSVTDPAASLSALSPANWVIAG